MDRIAEILKKRREELGLTLDQISDKTKLPLKHIEAIERGDIDYFKEDLSYLQFFVRTYCNVLGLDFNEVKGEVFQSIDEFTSAYEKAEIERREEMEEQIKHKANRLNQYEKMNTEADEVIKEKVVKQKVSNAWKKKGKFDFSYFLLFLIIAVVIIVLLFRFIFPQTVEVPAKEEQVTLDREQVNEEEQPVVHEDDADTTTEGQEKQAGITVKQDEQDPSRIFVSGAKDQTVSIETGFLKDCWTEFYLNKQMMKEPGAKVYSANSVASFELTPQTGDTIEIVYSNPGSVTNFKIADELISIDPSKRISRMTIEFVDGE